MNQNGFQGQGMNALFGRMHFRRGIAFGVIIIAALLAFEIFNYSTTDYALTDLLGDLTFLGVRWATILAIAFCGIDFAGIARLFTPEDGNAQAKDTWYLFGAWLLAATMNAMLTWWGVSLAILNHQTLGNAVIERGTLLRVVPIFVAVLVWLIRVLIIGTFSVAGDNLFSQAEQRYGMPQRPRPAVAPTLNANTNASNPAPTPVRSLGSRAPAPRPVAAAASAPPSFRPQPKPSSQPAETGYSRPDPTYQNISMSPGGSDSSSSIGEPNHNSSNPGIQHPRSSSRPGSQTRR